MNPSIATLLAFAVYFLAYRFYSRFLAYRVFDLDAERSTPAHDKQDGIDYVPTRPAVLFGHHFASITGLAPMLGPAIKSSPIALAGLTAAGLSGSIALPGLPVWVGVFVPTIILIPLAVSLYTSIKT